MQWRLDSAVVDGTITLPAGLSTVELWADEGGVERVDWRIIRVGAVPPLEVPPLSCRSPTAAAVTLARRHPSVRARGSPRSSSWGSRAAVVHVCSPKPWSQAAQKPSAPSRR